MLKLRESHHTTKNSRMRVLQKFFASFFAYYVIVSCISSVLGEIEPMPAESDVDFHDVSKINIFIGFVRCLLFTSNKNKFRSVRFLLTSIFYYILGTTMVACYF